MPNKLKSKKSLFTLKIFTVFFIAVCIFFTGYILGHQNIIFEKNYQPKIVSTELLKPRTVNFDLFWEAWKKVTENYVGELDPQKMIYGAISGMVDSLGDPHTAFMSPTKSKSYLEDLSGEISGIGAEISVKDGKLVIVSPIKDSQAEKYGLKANDQILKVNDEIVDNMLLDEAISKIRGKAGTKVKLLIMRSDFKEPQVFEIERKTISIKSVEWEMKENVAYIKISQFGEDTSTLISQAVSDLKNKNPKSIIIDLRNNPGGYLDAAVNVTSLFMEPGIVAKEQLKDGKIIEEKTTLEPVFNKIKIIVLINGGSASGSEIMAGALQDVGRATLVGEKSFGKGSVQTLEELTGGSTLKITTAKWLTPYDRAINGIGIEPDVNIKLTEEDFKASRDPQLEKALELAR